MYNTEFELGILEEIVVCKNAIYAIKLRAFLLKGGLKFKEREPILLICKEMESIFPYFVFIHNKLLPFFLSEQTVQS